jgi:mannose-6-phosphate isomerase-like protein (cupin superfamily)
MNLNFTETSTKKEVFEQVELYLKKHAFNIVTQDQTRPWGGFYVIDESQSDKFIAFFLKDIPEATTQSIGKISPKILVVEPGKRLSWQYHHRRSEVWKVIGGEVGVVISDTDQEAPMQTKKIHDNIILKKGERHRLIGTNGWGIIAEIWQHTDANHPSDEDDIVRVTDDFGR